MARFGDFWPSCFVTVVYTRGTSVHYFVPIYVVDPGSALYLVPFFQHTTLSGNVSVLCFVPFFQYSTLSGNINVYTLYIFYSIPLCPEM